MKLLDRVRHAIRAKHFSYRTEQVYVYWIERYIRYHGIRHPETMDAPEVEAFLTHLAVDGQVAASTQNQALAALSTSRCPHLSRRGWSAKTMPGSRTNRAAGVSEDCEEVRAASSRATKWSALRHFKWMLPPRCRGMSHQEKMLAVECSMPALTLKLSDRRRNKMEHFGTSKKMFGASISIHPPLKDICGTV